ncbi:DNA-binding transcription factor, calcineurin responsive Prz1 [Schizosaccharomyces pombe]|uniref:Transcriptional regulator prz1 n=1 Tax=Schizosaccharomyces pombe (strain 972 / ATCC 24843) TaxID=284812 RepID=PRZ1_SCHPO|nr:calcineurin-responsive transcription factor Prz1 [Schizosaccharomyces pombe]Q09838.1 RecName: Full=Transcriptional regulator prz1; AltName: Full=Pbp1-responsive zinc finger protein 1 [Schizosaccharomyces pombe 972h-]CAA91214.1 calcineurin responsive transcription factor Prz1 [Schizosaccharomyces pombe]|eukprot:NP_593073.1 calcineurin-responsive transcription factor Prz1 [Schizosaccharomyces pombe]
MERQRSEEANRRFKDLNPSSLYDNLSKPDLGGSSELHTYMNDTSLADIPLFEDTLASEVSSSLISNPSKNNIQHLHPNTSEPFKTSSKSDEYDSYPRTGNVPTFSFTELNDTSVSGFGSQAVFENSVSPLSNPSNSPQAFDLTQGSSSTHNANDFTVNNVGSRRQSIYEFNIGIPSSNIDSSQFLPVSRAIAASEISPSSSPQLLTSFLPSGSVSNPSSPYLQGSVGALYEADAFNFVDVMSQASGTEVDSERFPSVDFEDPSLLMENQQNITGTGSFADYLQPPSSGSLGAFTNASPGESNTGIDFDTDNTNLNPSVDLLSNHSTPSFIFENSPSAEFSHQSSPYLVPNSGRTLNSENARESTIRSVNSPFSEDHADASLTTHVFDPISPTALSNSVLNYDSNNFSGTPQINVVPSSPSKSQSGPSLPANPLLQTDISITYSQSASPVSGQPAMNENSYDLQNANLCAPEMSPTYTARHRSNSAGSRFDAYEPIPQLYTHFSHSSECLSVNQDTELLGKIENDNSKSNDYLSVRNTRPRSRSLNSLVGNKSENSSSSKAKSESKSQGNYVCTFAGCNKRFTRAYNLKSHMNTHTNYRPFQCSICKKSFARQHDKRRHEQLHTGIKAFACVTCNQRFARMDALNRHYKSEVGQNCLRTATERGIQVPPSRKTAVASTSKQK